MISELVENETLEEQIERLKRALEYSNSKLILYEMNGAAKLFYALNRKANEMADLLNKTNLGTLTLDDPKDKTFERLKIIWNDSASISTAIKELGIAAGVTQDENADTKRKPFVDTIAVAK